VVTSYDVVVVGGGPIGALAARCAAEVGARVLLVEQGDGSGDPARCTGLVSPGTMAVLGVSMESVLREIRGGILHAPGGRKIALQADTVKAVVLDRRRLNQELVELAAAVGVKIRLNTRAIAAGTGWVRFKSREKKVEQVNAGVVIGADGPRSNIALWFSLPAPKLFLAASQAVVVQEPYSPDRVEIFFGKDVAPGFFAWAVPAEEKHLRVGLAASPGANTDALLTRLLAQRFPGEIIARIGGLIPIDPCLTTAGEGVLLVGDAAGQVKPTSGGGIYTGGICARIAGEIAGYAALTGKTTKETLAEYERRWQRKIGGELRFGLAAHRVLAALTDPELDALFAAIDTPAVLRIIAQEGDIDYPSRLVRAFLSRQDLWPRFFTLIPALGGWERLEELGNLATVSGSCVSLS